MGDDTEEEFLINALINPEIMEHNINYIKTLYVLSKEPELEQVLKLLEYLKEAARTKKATNIDLTEQQQKQYAEEQNAANTKMELERMKLA